MSILKPEPQKSGFHTEQRSNGEEALSSFLRSSVPPFLRSSVALCDNSFPDSL